MKFIKLTLPDKSSVFVNISKCYDIFKNEKSEKNNTNISFGNDYVLSVLETPKEIIDILNKKKWN